jgi:hypothetical protein
MIRLLAQKSAVAGDGGFKIAALMVAKRFVQIRQRHGISLHNGAHVAAKMRGSVGVHKP